MLTEYVKERLALLVAEHRPRRAGTGSVQAPALGSPVRAPRTADPPDFEPSDDEVGVRGGETPAPPHRPLSVERHDEASASELVAASPALQRFGRPHLGVVVALLLIALVFGGWSVLRARPVAIASTPMPVSSPGATERGAPTSATTARVPTSSSSGSAKPVAKILVHVLGAVREPGVVTLPEGARVRDAITSAGGFTRSAAPEELNLAAVLEDGQQVVIGTARKPAGEIRSGSGAGTTDGAVGSQPGSAGVVDLNRATQVQLETLPGIGPVTAAKILAWRTEHGRFSRVEELQEVDGIGPKTYAELAPHARV